MVVNNLSAEMDIQGWVTPAVFTRIHYLQYRKRQTDVCILLEKRQVIQVTMKKILIMTVLININLGENLLFNFGTKFRR